MDELIRLNLAQIEKRAYKLCNYRSEAELARAASWTPRYMNQVFQATREGQAPGITTTKLNGLCNALRCKISTILVHDFDPPHSTEKRSG